MKILLAQPNPLEEAELIEFLQALSYVVESVYGRVELNRRLDGNDIDIVFYSVQNMDDFAQISYINHYYPQVKVIVSMENGLGSAIENIRSGAFRTIKKPYRLSELCDYCRSDAANRKRHD
jgi:DNA-binding NtrC family response regulator